MMEMSPVTVLCRFVVSRETLIALHWLSDECKKPCHTTVLQLRDCSYPKGGPAFVEGRCDRPRHRNSRKREGLLGKTPRERFALSQRITVRPIFILGDSPPAVIFLRSIPPVSRLDICAP